MIDSEIAAATDDSIDVDFSAPLADLPPPREPEPVVLDHDPEDFLRIVANPFLAFAMIAFCFALLIFVNNKKLFAGYNYYLSIVIGFVVLFSSAFYRYQCLDCGGSGRLTRWRTHHCPASADRRRLGKRRRIHGPNPERQVVIWLFLTAFIAIFVRSLIR